MVFRIQGQCATVCSICQSVCGVRFFLMRGHQSEPVYEFWTAPDANYKHNAIYA